MLLERKILIMIWAVIILLLLFCVPREKKRQAIIIFLTAQVFTWSISLILLELRWIQNPIREFNKAVAQNFTFNYALYPAVCVIYCLKYPRNQKPVKKLMYFLLYSLGLTLFICIIEASTNLIQFARPKWLKSILAFLLVSNTFYFVRKYYEWFSSKFSNYIRENKT